MAVKLLTKQHLEFLSLIGGCTGSFESIHVKIPHCLNYRQEVMFTLYRGKGTTGLPKTGTLYNALFSYLNHYLGSAVAQ